MKTCLNLRPASIGGLFWTITKPLKYKDKYTLVDSDFNIIDLICHNATLTNVSQIQFQVNDRSYLELHGDDDWGNMGNIEIIHWDDILSRAEKNILQYEYILSDAMSIKRPRTIVTCYRRIHNRDHIIYAFSALKTALITDIAALICRALLELFRCDSSWYTVV